MISVNDSEGNRLLLLPALSSTFPDSFNSGFEILVGAYEQRRLREEPHEHRVSSEENLRVDERGATGVRLARLKPK